MIKIMREFATVQEAIAFLSGSTSIASASIVTDDEGAPNANAPAVDSAGLPWDERIHSASKALKDNGTWRSRRGVSDGVIAAVTAELRSRMGMQQPQAPVPQHPQFNVQPGGPSQQPSYTPPQPQYTPQPNSGMQQPSYTPPQPNPAPGMQQSMDFGAFMQHISTRFPIPHPQGGMMIDANYLIGVTQKINAQLGTAFHAITEIGTRPDAITLAVGIINSEGRWQ